MLGREISTLINGVQDAGFKSVQWNATDAAGLPVSAGMYFYQIKAYNPDGIGDGDFVETRKMILLK